MNSSIRPFVSASFGPALTVFTACSAYFNGPTATVTTVAFALTVVYGIVETALHSYTPIDSVELGGPSLLLDDPAAREQSMEPHGDTMIRFPEAARRPARAA